LRVSRQSGFPASSKIVRSSRSSSTSATAFDAAAVAEKLTQRTAVERTGGDDPIVTATARTAANRLSQCELSEAVRTEFVD